MNTTSNRFDPSSPSDRAAREVVDAGILVHRELGPGLLESVYEEALVSVLSDRRIALRRQLRVPIEFRGRVLTTRLRVDLFVDDCLVVEVKAVERLTLRDHAQLFTYLKLTNAPLGLLMNFNERLLKDGVVRVRR